MHMFSKLDTYVTHRILSRMNKNHQNYLLIKMETKNILKWKEQGIIFISESHNFLVFIIQLISSIRHRIHFLIKEFLKTVEIWIVDNLENFAWIYIIC